MKHRKNHQHIRPQNKEDAIRKSLREDASNFRILAKEQKSSRAVKGSYDCLLDVREKLQAETAVAVFVPNSCSGDVGLSFGPNDSNVSFVVLVRKTSTNTVFNLFP